MKSNLITNFYISNSGQTEFGNFGTEMAGLKSELGELGVFDVACAASPTGDVTELVDAVERRADHMRRLILEGV